MKQLIKISSLSLIVVFFLAFSISAQDNGKMKNSMHKVKTEKTVNVKSFDKNNDGKVYQCPMCSDEISDTPGTCPKCGMELKEVSVKEAAAKFQGKGMMMHKGMMMQMDSTKKGMMQKGQMHKGMMMQKAKNQKGMMQKKMMTSGMVHKGVIDVKALDKNGDGKVFQDQMDWNIISDNPGTCPLCGMELKEVTVEKAIKNLKEHGFKTK